MDFTKQLPPPEDPPENRSPEYRSPENQSPEDRSPENRPPENRRPENRTPDKRSPEKRSPKNQSPAKPPYSEALYRPIGEIPALLPPPIDGLSEQKEAQQTPAVVVIRDEMVPATKTEDGMEGGGGGRTRPEEFPPVVVVNRSVRKETAVAQKVEEVGSGPYRLSSIHRRSRREAMIWKASLGFRVLGLIFCLVSFAVMAADKTQGWAGDSFDRYKEYRYCISITVIGFVYSGFQAFIQAQLLVNGKQFIQHPIRYYFDFSMDQILAYLLMSASSSAATRTDDWVLNWGEDEFTKMASASIGMSFLAFFAFAFSCLISGYNLCNRNS
ncbi:hypothetical protein MRB53_018601 [Persea americana]|uniref:Uncharacterized protein n=1 Tax=Persea americana TaxID=3435 RepID=A0ACC2M7Y3_PERAE|nr:hypothetical protein MRB53_018601 [Persea americana]|eukprot:TRINITY_DN4056_c0_g1_i1.p1 TRINITY_DN4056_c0_g1~~TRINITY_DN4056_c0_g1_i1.p1  ORF type:complete len:327 (+),score=24.20 TRINITY_DN4056_c0_g1_i1:197-1177(+)